MKLDRDSHDPKLDLAEIEPVIASVCETLGVELVQLRMAHERGAAILRVMIDRPSSALASAEEASGVTLADCTDVSRSISTALDALDYGKERYHLEVGSPGLDRPLVKRHDFERFAGREVRVKTSAPIDGRRAFGGKLVGIEDGVVRVETDGKTYEIPFDEIAKANLVHRF